MALVLERTEIMLSIVRGTIEENVTEIDTVEYSESRDGSSGYKIFKKNGYWGAHDAWYRFRTRFTIPAEYEGRRVRCRLITGSKTAWNPLDPQFLLYINGNVIQGIDGNHDTFDLSLNAKVGETYVMEFEAYAGREIMGLRFQDYPVQFSLYAYCHNEDTEKLYYDLKAAKMAAEMYNEKDYLRIQIENYLTNALNLLDCRVPCSKTYLASVRDASRYLQENFYDAFCGNETVIADCIGHSHIDVAWKWRLEQTRRKAVRSFATELVLLEEYPEHRFTASQPQLYQYVKEDCPEVYEKIKEYVKVGRWEVEGAMWLEADCNLSSGESLIRQILHGKRFMQEEFGVDSKVLWLPDVFGYSAALPQILKKTGIEAFVTSKIHWNDTNHFPYDTFLWKGIDGSEIFTQFITASEPNAKLGDNNFYSTYNAILSPISITKGWEIYQQKDINNEILVTFGHGDGGGGVNREMLEMGRRLQCGIPGVPRTRITTVQDTISRIIKNTEGKKLPKWSGELYLEFHRGTYTSMAANKRYNRKAELLLQCAESVCLIHKLLLDGEYAKNELYESWNTVLLNQFHDIIPGSSIKEVYEDSHQQYKALFEENSVRVENAVRELAKKVSEEGIFVYNPSGIMQSGLVEAGGTRMYVTDIPAYGWRVLKPESAYTRMQISTTCMENDFYRLELDDKGTFTSIYDKRACRQVLKEGERGNVLLAFDDHPHKYDNWELCCYYKEKVWEIDGVEDIQIIEESELSASLKITRSFLHSSIEQVITIYRNIPRIDFNVNIDWHENHIFVKTAFPVDVLSDKATYEIQYGAVERPTHTNTSWDEAKFEVCAHKWADYAENGYGVALINDCKYGYDIHDGVMRLSLLKCGTYPNAEADQGHHEFKYALMPHMGSWQEAGVANEAYAFNCPLIATKAEGRGNLKADYSFAMADQDNIFISVVKESCDGNDVIIRAYEAYGKRTKTKIKMGFPIQEVLETDMLENNEIDQLSVDSNSFEAVFKPFEIKTFRMNTKGEVRMGDDTNIRN